MSGVEIRPWESVDPEHRMFRHITYSLPESFIVAQQERRRREWREAKRRYRAKKKERLGVGVV